MAKLAAPRKARGAATESRASRSVSPDGMTAREAVDRYCADWTRAGYLAAWPWKNEPNPHVSEDKKEEIRKTISNELSDMLYIGFGLAPGGSSGHSRGSAGREPSPRSLSAGRTTTD